MRQMDTILVGELEKVKTIKDDIISLEQTFLVLQEQILFLWYYLIFYFPWYNWIRESIGCENCRCPGHTIKYKDLLVFQMEETKATL